jgi:hypothetical protein
MACDKFPVSAVSASDDLLWPGASRVVPRFNLSPQSKTAVPAQEHPPFPARHYVPARIDGELPVLSRTRASALRAPLPWIYC